MSQIILYTTNCPKCKVLEQKLKMKNVKYEEVNDIELMEKKGFMTAPMLEIEGKVMNFKEANDWINSLLGGFDIGNQH